MIKRSIKDSNHFYIGAFKEENYGDVVYLLVVMNYRLYKKLSLDNFIKKCFGALILIIDEENDFQKAEWESATNPNNPIVCEAGVIEFLDKLKEVDRSTYNNSGDLFGLKIKEDD